MHITELLIHNFRAIKSIHLAGLPRAILIAGPNGCGKSCIFDSIRLLKSIYGGYQPNEVNQWFSEFQINPNSLRTDINRIFQDPTKNLVIEAHFSFSEAETDFLRSEASEIIEHLFWGRRVPALLNTHYKARPITADLQRIEPVVKKEAEPVIKEFHRHIGKQSHLTRVTAMPNGQISIQNNLPVQVAFSIFEPGRIGVIDFHGANRSYAREQVGGINLNLETSQQHLRQHALYNYVNKYSNVKQEIAAEYIRGLLASAAGSDDEETRRGLSETLTELFDIFFEGKEYRGPKPTRRGGLDFPVCLPSGVEHDINDLSSGEKEVLYGYLRLRHSAPRDSIVLIDEPELHLNPRLVRGLPRFYRKHVGEALGNQLWLVTHSDEFLRQAVGESGYAVFHMFSPGAVGAEQNQAKRIDADDALERAIIDLVGDLATYAPNKKIVIFEGEDSEFDIRMTLRLFPGFSEHINAIAGGNKVRVQKLHFLLDKAAKDGKLNAAIYSIVDRDAGVDTPTASAQSHTWDVYHIENYLLHPQYISEAIDELTLGESKPDTSAVDQLLKQSASESINRAISVFAKNRVSSEMVNCIDLGFDQSTSDVCTELVAAIDRSKRRFDEKVSGPLGRESIRELVEKERTRLVESLKDDTWKSLFRGRDVLKQLTGNLALGVSYEVLRNTVIAKMVDGGYQPAGMKTIIDAIVSDTP